MARRKGGGEGERSDSKEPKMWIHGGKREQNGWGEDLVIVPVWNANLSALSIEVIFNERDK